MSVKIIGGGIQGLTTGVFLELKGYNTEIISKDFSYISSNDISTTSTNYAGASIYPAHVESSNNTLNELIQYGESTFEILCNKDEIPVRKHKGYVLYENECKDEIPNRKNAKDIEDINYDILPRYENRQINDGYSCDEYFVEMPEYIPYLYETYIKLGGTDTVKNITRDDINDLNKDNTIINCTGYGSRQLFNDDNMIAIKGHILKVPYNGKTPLDFSYTYHPKDYEKSLYMYPRRNNILFGGSSLKGQIENDEWKGESPSNELEVDGVKIPERIYKVNKNIMRNYIQIDSNNISADYGFRPYRKTGVRIEKDENEIIHNYGHGGAGVTLSLWSASKVLNIFEENDKDSSDNTEIINRLAEEMNRLV